MKLSEHGIVLGTTQSGKTSRCLELMNELGSDCLKIFVNTKREQKWNKFFKHKIETPEQMTDIYEHYEEFTPFFLLIEPIITNRNAVDDIAKIFDVSLLMRYKFIRANLPEMKASLEFLRWA